MSHLYCTVWENFLYLLQITWDENKVKNVLEKFARRFCQKQCLLRTSMFAICFNVFKKAKLFCPTVRYHTGMPWKGCVWLIVCSSWSGAWGSLDITIVYHINHREAVRSSRSGARGAPCIPEGYDARTWNLLC